MNLILFVFNMLPVPPLDGSVAMGLMLSDENGRRAQNAMRRAAFAWIGLILDGDGVPLLLQTRWVPEGTQIRPVKEVGESLVVRVLCDPASGGWWRRPSCGAFSPLHLGV
jgi:hypothetical protein